MAGHVLRDSKGRFKGSTRGFGAGRKGQGGGNPSRGQRVKNQLVRAGKFSVRPKDLTVGQSRRGLAIGAVALGAGIATRNPRLAVSGGAMVGSVIASRKYYGRAKIKR